MKEVSFLFVTPEGYRYSIKCPAFGAVYSHLEKSGYTHATERELKDVAEPEVNRVDSSATFYKIEAEAGWVDAQLHSDEAEDIEEWAEFRRRNAGGE